MKYACPRCKANLEIQKTFNQKIVVSCTECNLEDILEFSKNPDEIYLNFLTKFDDGKIPDKNQMSLGLKKDGIIRDENDIKKMIDALHQERNNNERTDGTETTDTGSSG